MSDKITVTLEASKLRDLVYIEEYTNKNGEVVKTQKVKFELVPVKEPKTVYSAEKYELSKTHFASVIQTKEEREAKADTIFIGEGVSLVWKNEQQQSSTPISNVGDDSELPF